MKTLPIQPQPRLSIARTFVITIHGIRYRLFRSAVTMVVVSVAIAFMMNILSEGILKRSVVRMTRDRIAEMRLVSKWTGKLSVPPSVEDILSRLSRPHSTNAGEALSLAGLPDDSMATLSADAARATRYLAFFESLGHAKRRLLVHGATGSDVFERLSEPRSLRRFKENLAGIRSVRLPTSVAAFEQFLQDWPGIRGQVDRVRSGWEVAIARIRSHAGDQHIAEALRNADGRTGEVIREAGFLLDQATARDLAYQARQVSHRRRLEGTLSRLEVRQFVAGRLDILPGQVNGRRFWGEAGKDIQTAKLFLNTARASGVDLSEIDAERVCELAQLRAAEATLERADQASGDVGSGPLGLGERTAWLVLISVVVCVVGIANVMLISVAERFREIATLKCLGALDGFIMLSFVLEAALLGLFGGLIGAVLGTMIGFGRTFTVFGSLAFAAFPALQVLQAVVLSVVLGIVLAAVAAVYPSFRAARLPPMEAMRIE
jgi:FtsX-like permease family protein